MVLLVSFSALRQNLPLGLVKSGGQRSYSVDRATTHISPTYSRRSPLSQQLLDPSSTLKRKPATENVAQRRRHVGKMHVIGSFSSSEEDLVTTPEYTSADEPDSKWLHANSQSFFLHVCTLLESCLSRWT